MLSEPQRRKIIMREASFVKKLVRMEALSIQLGKLLGHSIFTLDKSLGCPEGKWMLDVSWSNYGSGSVRGGHDEVTYVRLRKGVRGWVRYKWRSVMVYHRSYGSGSREETRRLSVFDDSVVAVLDELSDELEEQIAKASRATQEHREQFREVVENHPRKERNRFDQIDPRP